MTTPSAQSKSVHCAAELRNRTISQIAQIIKSDWASKINPFAAPYLEALHIIHSDSASYGAEDARSIVLYFLVNAQSWRGETARLVKAEFKRRFNIK